MSEQTGVGKPQHQSHTTRPNLDWLTVRRDQLKDDHARYHAREVRWSRIRLIVFVAGILAVVLVRRSAPLTALSGVVGLAAFAGAVMRHIRWEDKRAFAERMLTVVVESLHASTNRDLPARTWWRPDDPEDPAASLPVMIEPGPTWPLSGQERDDLDLYGPPVGIFGLLNRTSTQLGARRLRDMLDSPCLSPEYIRQRQHAVRWLDQNDEQRLGLMANLVLLRDCAKQLDSLVQLLHTTEPSPRSILSKVVRLWSVISGLIFIYAVLRISAGQFAWVQPIMILLLVNMFPLFLLRPTLRRLHAAVSPWTTLRSTLDHFLTIAQDGARELPNEGQLRQLTERFHKVVTDARIPSLCRWLEWAGLHGMVRGLLNALVFLDLHIGEAVLARVVPNRDVLLYSLSAMAEFEALSSLACFSAEQPVACYPEPTDETGLFIEDGRHPLILAQDAVPNDAHLSQEKRTWVITGPNAAGKSTFLRMVGVNILLAQAGAAVAARGMTWSPVRLITDVRIRDDLARNESYFLSEVRRLRRLVLDEGSSTPILGMIDEPFRGTNSQERTAAGIALLEHLMASSNLFLVATHEELLAQVAAIAPSAENYHFQEHLHDGGITFDYRLRPGPATTRTALRILEGEGYPNSLLQRARELIGDDVHGAKLD